MIAKAVQAVAPPISKGGEPKGKEPKPRKAKSRRETKSRRDPEVREMVRPCDCACGCERDRCCSSWYFEKVCCFSQHVELYCCGCSCCGESLRCSSEILPCSRWCCVCVPDPDGACGRGAYCCDSVEAARIPGHPKYRRPAGGKATPAEAKTSRDSHDASLSDASASGSSDA